jgi:predicted nucleic acid-binding protein
MTNPDSPRVARQKILSIASLPHLLVLPLTAEIQWQALELCEKHGVSRQNFFDMQLAASMHYHGLTVLFTENTKDFAGITGIQAVNPFPTAAGPPASG